MGLPQWLRGKESTCNAGGQEMLVSSLCQEDPPWKKKWHPTPVFLPGECHEQRVWQATVHEATKSQT